jgi:hypothetical protein
MIDATSLGIKKLIEDIGFCFVVPILALLFGFANSRLRWNRRDSAFRIRLVLTVAILLFLFAICTVIVQDRIILDVRPLADHERYEVLLAGAEGSCRLLRRDATRRTATGCKWVYRYYDQERKRKRIAFDIRNHPTEADVWKAGDRVLAVFDSGSAGYQEKWPLPQT